MKNTKPFSRLRIYFLRMCLLAAAVAAAYLLFVRFTSPRWTLPPAVFVGDTHYVYRSDQGQAPPTLAYLGDIRRAVPTHKSPRQNFETNSQLFLDAPVYRTEPGVALRCRSPEGAERWYLFVPPNDE